MATLILVYLLIGILFALAFFAVGYRKIDPSAESARWYVRLMWMPAALALWPLLLKKWLRPAVD